MDTHSFYPSYPLAELHAHLAASIHPSIYWQIAHDSGLKLPKKEYHEFISYVTLSTEKKKTIEEYFSEIYHPLLDKLSSGTFALEKAVYEIMSGAYRNNITLLELRGNPMKHNAGGAQDLDHIIMAMLRGMEKAFLEFPKLSAGLIFCLARESSLEKNAIIVEKAIKYKNRGVVGIDIAGPEVPSFQMSEYKQLFEKARKAGLKTTVHSGETIGTNDMWEAVEHIQPQRIGHGIKAAYDKKLMRELVKRGIVLEVCPMSNIVTKAVENIDELQWILRTLIENNVLFSINTDWPEMIEDAHLSKQFTMLLREKILTKEELEKCNQIAFAAAFAPQGGLSVYL